MVKKRLFKYLLQLLCIVLLLLDAVHSFRQHLVMPMDGDMIPNVLCLDGVEKVVSDPFALKVLFDHEAYINPNRYVSHLSHAWYMWNVPLLIQKMGVEPLESIYVTQAIFKISVQILLIILIAVFSMVGRKWNWLDFLVSAVIVTPFFQTCGYNRQIGIIDQSATYDFFYAWPMVFVLLFFLPIAKAIVDKRDIPGFIALLLVPCAFLVAFSGPLNLGTAPIGLILIVGLLFFNACKNVKTWSERWHSTPRRVVYVLAWLGLLCGYSIYINSQSGTMAEDIPPLAERYSLFVSGLIEIFAMAKGLTFLCALLVFNLLVGLYIFNEGEKRNLTRVYTLVALACALYLLLLPLGGYRSYRPLVVRYDTFMPVTTALVWLAAFSSLRIGRCLHTSLTLRIFHATAVATVLVHLTQKDLNTDTYNMCEIEMIRYIQNSSDYLVSLPKGCSVMEWSALTDYRNTIRHATLLRHWNVLKEDKRFYYKPE